MKRLFDALGVQASDVVSFVGAGGKTTAMLRLAHELVEDGGGVVVTTTTRLREPFVDDVPVILIEPDPAVVLAQLPALVARHRLVAVAVGRTSVDPSSGYRKLLGVDPELVGRISQLAEVTHVLVEADGARGCSLKVPAAHEPVIPVATTLLVPVAAVDAVGQAVNSSRVHRPELVAALTGLHRTDIVTCEAVAAVLGHACGGLKGRPPLARVVPLINKARASEGRQRALNIALRLVEMPAISRVVVGAVVEPCNAFEVVSGAAGGVPGERRRVTAVVLAAGASMRYGECKQLALVGGRPMAAAVARVALEADVEEVAVVIGCLAGQVRAALAGLPVTIVENEEWQEGIGSSVRCGVAAVAASADAVLFILADQAKLSSSEINAVVSRYRQAGSVDASAGIIVPAYSGRRGNPVLFGRSLFPELLECGGGVGGRVIIQRHADAVTEVPVPTAGVIFDVDTPGDLLQAHPLGR